MTSEDKGTNLLMILVLKKALHQSQSLTSQIAVHNAPRGDSSQD